MVEQCVVFYRRDHMDGGGELSILIVHLLLPPFRSSLGHRTSHQNGTSVSWTQVNLSLVSWVSPVSHPLNHFPGMAVARLLPGAPGVLLA